MQAHQLYRLAIEHGGMALVPAELCQAHRVHRAIVWAVLVHRLHTGDEPRSSIDVSTDLGLDLRTVLKADAALEEARLILREGAQTPIRLP